MSRKAVDPGARTDQVALMLENGYLPAVTVANRVGVSLTTVGRWADGGLVEFEVMGHRRYIKVSSLIDHIGPVQAAILGLSAPEQPRKKRKSVGEKS